MNENEYPARRLLIDKEAISENPSLPAFIARPTGAPAYHGFSIVTETETDGWCFGAITEFESDTGCDSGDGFVVAPDGSRAGIVWEVGAGDLQSICSPDDSRWGVYAVWFPLPVRTADDLVKNFRAVLPDLKRKYLEVKSQS